MKLDIPRTRNLLQQSDFKRLFIEELGWDQYASKLDITVDGQNFTLGAIAEKRGMVAFQCNALPDYNVRRKIEREVAKSAHEHLIIYTDPALTNQIWQWVKREAGKPKACREHHYHRNQSGDALIQKLRALVFTLEDEENLTIVDVAARARSAFDVERVTRRFYDRFKTEHSAFLKFLKGIPDEDMLKWYASVMLNRLMFIYFIQKKGFLNNDTNYLRNKLARIKDRGKDLFYSDFLCPLFFEGFAKKESERSAEASQLLGKVPYLNGGIFQRHQIEELHGKAIRIADAAFEKLFDFFDAYQWHLDERPLRADNEINPDVLGYIFEKYINQKQMGAYYTKEDITGYISKNTVIPFLFDVARQKCKIAFVGANGGSTRLTTGDSPDTTVWRLLQSDPDRYIYEAVRRGVIDEDGNVFPESSLPDFVQKGMHDPNARMFDKRYNLGQAVVPDSEGNNLALPTETWREYVERRKRCLELRDRLAKGEIRDINDLITYNLDIRQFAQDVIENCEGPELLRAFYHAIEKVTVLDPTCGSGAFLFAALNILEPLYEACLDRMEAFLSDLERSGEKHRPEKFSDFRKILDRVAQHPNPRYFILKSIIVNNLFGVDIMEEAVEICKLRLFLKLVAQIERVEDIEPLPDIDFNIRAGNTLVGFANYDEVKRAVTSKLDFDNTMARIEEKAQDIDRLFVLFRQQQTELEGEVTPEDKQELRNRLKVLEDELNRYLAGEYGIDVNKKVAYEKWLSSHKPFHWFIEFYGIIKSGGFDVIIGNPPYVEYSKVKDEYTIKGYETESCGNLYAFVMERSLSILNTSGRFGMIAPVSLGSTPRMLPLRRMLTNNASHIYYSNFADRPSCLFIGVHQILSICVMEKSSNGNSFLMSSGFNHWLNDERNFLFENLIYVQSEEHIIDGAWGKFSDLIELRIFSRIKAQKKNITSYYSRQGKLLAVSGGTGGYWLRAFDVPQQSNEYRQYFVADKDTRLALCAILNSNAFYWLWRKYSDCRHLTKSDMAKFTIDFDTAIPRSLVTIGEKQILALKGTKETRYGKMTYEQYRPSRTKLFIDSIDRVLAQHYGFTDEELDFIINYDIKYRMGLGTEEESGE
ncbi:MAG TPA: DNA methyltransferase [Thermodesulfobacteriota bacterium]|nr:DNA methyltransferase [Thermodesulfobacteriota bacterium]